MNGEPNEKKLILSVLVQNHAGVLQRVAGLFSRRCYNIADIVAAQTENHAHSRLIIVVYEDEKTTHLIKSQLMKLTEVEAVTLLTQETAVIREHMLIKIDCSPQKKESLTELAKIFHAQILNVSDIDMIFELTGDTKTLDSFVDVCEPHGIKELLRTGSMAMQKSEGSQTKN